MLDNTIMTSRIALATRVTLVNPATHTSWPQRVNKKITVPYIVFFHYNMV